MPDRPGPRLFVTDDLAGGVAAALSPGQAHYLKNVMRLGPGAPLVLFNGRDGEWRGRIGDLRRGGGSATVETQRRPQAPEPDVWLLFAPIKRAPLDFMIQKAVELGVSRLCPVRTRYTDVARVNLERARSTVVEAAEQCERLTLPEVAAPMQLSDLLATWPGGRPLILCAEAGQVRPLADVLEEFQPGDGGKLPGMAVLVGPEGGFERTELDAIRKLPFVTPAGLGPRVLRAETAALAALACWQSVLGDWHTCRIQPAEAT